MKLSKTIMALVFAVFALAIYGDVRAQSFTNGGISPFCTAYQVVGSTRSDVPLGAIRNFKSSQEREGRVEFSFYDHGGNERVSFRVSYDQASSVWKEISRCFGGSSN